MAGKKRTWINVLTLLIVISAVAGLVYVFNNDRNDSASENEKTSSLPNEQGKVIEAIQIISDPPEKVEHSEEVFLDVVIMEKAGVKPRLIQSNIEERELAKERIDQYEIWNEQQRLGIFSLRQQALSTGNLYYFLHYKPEVTIDQEVQIQLPIDIGSQYTYRYIDYPNGIDYTKSTWKSASPGNQNMDLPKQSVFIDSEHGSFFLSYVEVFELQENGVKKEQYELAEALIPSNHTITYILPQIAGHEIEQWGITSQTNMIAWDDEVVTTDLRIADLNRSRKWSNDGPYMLTPTSYTPTSPTSFFRNPSFAVGEKFLRTEHRPFFEDFAIVNLYMAVETQNEKGYWVMTNQSNWLFDDYSIPDHYYDTRFSTDAGIFLVRGYHRYADEALLEAAIKYGDFLVHFAEDHHFKTKNGGYLVWDYGHDQHPDIQTHVSLNHLITEMNFLYELYLITGNTSYYDMANLMKVAVQDTHLSWYKASNGDLWYAYMVNGTYGLLDYPLLTLKDLRYSQKLVVQIFDEEDPAFNYLIKVKEAYLRKNNLPLY